MAIFARHNRFLDSGLAKDNLDCTDLVDGSSCWEECKAHQETNNFCRNPEDAAGPYCRTGMCSCSLLWVYNLQLCWFTCATYLLRKAACVDCLESLSNLTGCTNLSLGAGGTEEAPEFSACTQLKLCQDTGCTYDLEDASDYSGMVHHTVDGHICLNWDQFPEYAAVVGDSANFCRNPNGELARAWCFTAEDGTKGYCNIGRQCPFSVSDNDSDEYDKLVSDNDDNEYDTSGDEKLESGLISSAASLSASPPTYGAKAHGVVLMYERRAHAARVELFSQMKKLGHSMESLA